MGAESINAWASVAALVIVGASTIAALVQLRHMRAGNQLEALLSLERDFRDGELQSALAYIQTHLPERLEEPAYRQELERIGFIDSATHPEMIACNWLNEMGTLVKRRLVSEDTFMDLFGRLIVHCWKLTAPAIAIMRRNRGDTQYHDFEYLAARAAAWLQRNPHGAFPHTFPRVPLPDPWHEADRAPGPAAERGSALLSAENVNRQE